MILQALYDYYQRKASDPANTLEPEGFVWKSIPFILVLNRQGEFIKIEDTRENDGKNIKSKEFLLPKIIRSSVKANLLWDNTGYILGRASSDKIKDLNRAKKQYKSWTESLLALPEILKKSSSIAALCMFYSQSREEIIDILKQDVLWDALNKTDGTNALFKIIDDPEPIPCLEQVREQVSSNLLSDTAGKARCLITGELSIIAIKHTPTPINKDCKSFVGFQKESGYDSYRKSQGNNAPVSQSAEAAYTSALNMLLKKGSKNKVQIIDTVTLFWSKKKTEFENIFSKLWRTNNDNPDEGIQAVATLLKSPYTGAAVPESDIKFYILGLGPGGGSRIAVRYWYVGTVQEFSEKITQHFLDLKIVEPTNKYDQKIDQQETHGNYIFDCLLRSIAVEGKEEKIPSNLAADTMRAILTGSKYPATLLQQTIRRIRATQQVKRIQAAILKASLNRKARLNHDPKEEITMSLDPTNTNPGYRLGRLFAVFEEIQKDALGKINATIRDRFYGAASSSPVTVFPQLLKLKNYHLRKISKPAFIVNYEKLITEIMNDFPNSMPSHFCMEDQARFAIGYYHQRQALYLKAEK